MIRRTKVNIDFVHHKTSEHSAIRMLLAYLQTVAEAAGLVLGLLGDGGVRPMRDARPHALRLAGVPVLVGRLVHLRANLHTVIRIGLDQRFGGEQAEICTTKIA